MKCIQSKAKLKHSKKINSENSLGLQTALSWSSLHKRGVLCHDLSAACEKSKHIHRKSRECNKSPNSYRSNSTGRANETPQFRDNDSEKQANTDTNYRTKLLKCLQIKGWGGEMQTQLRNTSMGSVMGSTTPVTYKTLTQCMLPAGETHTPVPESRDHPCKSSCKHNLNIWPEVAL